MTNPGGGRLLHQFRRKTAVRRTATGDTQPADSFGSSDASMVKQGNYPSSRWAANLKANRQTDALKIDWQCWRDGPALVDPFHKGRVHASGRTLPA